MNGPKEKSTMDGTQLILERFLRYIGVDSESLSEGGFAAMLAQELKDLGLEVWTDDSAPRTGSQTGNLIARLKGGQGMPLMLSAHMDTVKPGRGIKPVVEGGVVRSDGTTILGADDKAGIAAIVEAFKVIKEGNLPHGTVEAVFSTCEEIGLRGAKHLDLGSLEARMAFVLDSGGEVGDLVVQGPAQEKMEILVHGKEAHAGVSPEKGISAIYLAAKAVSEMRLFRIDEETTANIGSIEGGGATNIIPALVRLTAEARSLDDAKLDAQVAHMKECFERAAASMDASVEFKSERTYSAFKAQADSPAVRCAKAAAFRLGFRGISVSTGGGSDTNIYNEKGLPTVTLGIGMHKAHTMEEYIAVEDLAKARDLVLALVEEARILG
ncbi:MAG: M20/M25/M40 family metallo-hydrolase [Spirochaetota bacterium]